MTESEPRERRQVSLQIAVVLPCFRVRAKIIDVLARIGPEVGLIYVVDDACPEQSGQAVLDRCADPRVRVLFNERNQGVGGAVLHGMQRAVQDGADIIVKVDGDGQMDPALIPNFVAMIARGEADYTKGNRFFEPEGLSAMPAGRLIGNIGLSFFSKFSTGYWNVFDPTNGYVAIHASLMEFIPVEKIAKRYFFESDMLFRLNLIGAKVVDIPMQAHYADEQSSLHPIREVPRFAMAHIRNMFKRFVYSYLLRDFSVATLELVLGLILLVFGVAYGIVNWSGTTTASAGTVMMAALPVILGVQLFLAFLNFDIQSVPRTALHPRLQARLSPGRELSHPDGQEAVGTIKMLPGERKANCV